MNFIEVALLSSAKLGMLVMLDQLAKISCPLMIIVQCGTEDGGRSKI